MEKYHYSPAVTVFCPAADVRLYGSGIKRKAHDRHG